MKQLVLIVACVMASGAALAESSILDGVAATARVERLPIQALYKVTEADGSVKYLSDDQRFVFVGKMYDLWQGEAMTAGVGPSRKINLNRNGVSIEKIAFPVGDAFGERTLFVAPECEDCRGLLRLALETGPDDLNVVLLAASEAGRRANDLVWCSKNRVDGLRTVYLEKKEPKQSEVNRECDRFGLMLAQQAAMVFGIGQLPLYVDAEGNGHVGESAIYAVSKKD
jgi:hypothetical protein